MNNIVLFGITGDLARHKVIPALFSLYTKRELNTQVHFFGFGRKPFTKKQFNEYIVEVCGENSNEFAKRWVYIQSELDDSFGYEELSKRLVGSALVYISLPPTLYIDIVRQLVTHGVIKKGDDRKIAFEKPFGTNLLSSRKLEKYVSAHVSQSQIIRIDHYVGKEALIDLEKAGRLGILDHSLNSKRIKKIDIRFHEKKTAEKRGAFYDSVGALYDVGQNHVLYILSSFLALPYLHTVNKTPSSVSMKELSSVVFSKKSVLHQYVGFLKEEGVRSDSTTETFFAIYGKVKNKKSVWNGVDIVLSGGKALKENDVSIYLHFVGAKKPVRIGINGYGKEEAYVHVFRNILNGNHSAGIDFKQIELGWSIVERYKQGVKNIKTYAVGKTPLF